MSKLIITEEERSRILGMHQNATSKQYLSEQPIKNIAFNIQINLPLNNEGQADMNGKASFTLSGLGNKSSQEYTGIITSMLLGGNRVPGMSDQKLVGETITGNIWLKNDQKLYSILQPMMGKSQLFVKDPNFMVVLGKKQNPSDPSSTNSEQAYLGNVTVGSYKPLQAQA